MVLTECSSVNAAGFAFIISGRAALRQGAYFIALIALIVLIALQIDDFIDIFDRMGANQCDSIDEADDEYIDIVRIPNESKELKRFSCESQIRSPEEDAQSLRSLARQSISKIKIKQKVMHFDILNRSFHPLKMKVDLSNDSKVLKQYQDKENRFNIYSVEIGQRERGAINLSFVNVTKTNALSAIAFAGEYNGTKKERGVYFFFTATEAFMFQGEFGDKENSGLKVTIGKGMREKLWGRFNSKFQANGQGLLQAYYENQDRLYEQHFFQGNFMNGLKEGKGLLKIKEAKELSLATLPNERQLDSKRIDKVQGLLGKNQGEYDTLINNLVKLIESSAKYSAIRPVSRKDGEYHTIIDSEWKNNTIEGIAVETWLNLNFRFEGIYHKNQRNGYGEEYADDQLIAKGFYRNGIMETDKDNELQLMGFRYNANNEQWRRDKE